MADQPLIDRFAGRDAVRNLGLLYESARQARLPFERDWWLNTAFYLDEQYVQWAPDSNSLTTIPNKYGRPRPVVNKINHFVQQRLAFALEHEPAPDVLPARDDPIAAIDAEVALAYVQHAARPSVGNWPRARAQAILWALVAGPGWFKWCWDPQENKPMILPPSPFEIYADPYATDYTRARYIIHSKFMDPEQVEEQYGVKPKAGAEKMDPLRGQLLREMGQAPVLEGLTVNEIWMKPTKSRPAGLFAVWTGQQLLMAPTQLPYKRHREQRLLPFTQIGVVPRPGSLYYDSHVKYLRKPQMELNKYHSQRIQIRENFASPKWWVPDELELKEDPDDSANQILRGHSDVAGLKPEILQASGMADDNEGDWIRSDMMDVVGLHEVSQGQVPGRVESSKAIELLKESDAGLLKTLLDTVNEAISVGYWQLLMLAGQYETPDKMVQVYSPEGLPQVRHFRKEVAHPDVQFVVTQGTGLAWSRAARTDQILRLWETGIWQNDPNGANRVLELLDIGSPTPLTQASYDLKLARAENLTIAGERPIKPNSWDNHEIHLREHNNYRKTAEYQALSDDAKSKFEFHCDAHRKLQVVEVRRQAELQFIAQGGEIAQEQQAAQAAATQGGGQGGAALPGGGQEEQGPAAQGTTTTDQEVPGQPPEDTQA